MKNIGVFCLLRRGDKIVLVKTKRKDLNWVLPGGAVNLKESLHEALLRELLEEVNFVPNNKPIFRCVFYSIEKYSLAFCYELFLENNDLKNIQFGTVSNNEIGEVGLFDIDYLPSLISKRTRIRIENVINNNVVYLFEYE
ncbi:MAG: hypothetical protein AUJ23_04100 [Candidatus Magasanikbacteria bacterium CG1_02_32_51]|uniref:Nudix hydrolase domain-containing protein n=1 Tax=Candidatus Magasanikbacteria bacterium CG1_02_32_51 TaxID=1805238 RepID=A0A1J4U6R3_9BACT|nr:MAG: hypothetical protein AUJ23_04100 [Candidatus Magasanikbacteria bacterium CG1_02_32_51]